MSHGENEGNEEGIVSKFWKDGDLEWGYEAGQKSGALIFTTTTIIHPCAINQRWNCGWFSWGHGHFAECWDQKKKDGECRNLEHFYYKNVNMHIM